LLSVDELLEFMETLGFAISFATCQSGNRSDYLHVEGLFVQGPGPAGPETLTHHPFFIIGSFY